MTKKEAALKVFKEGFLPQMSQPEIKDLLRRIKEGDPALIRGKFTDPAPTKPHFKSKVRAADLITLYHGLGKRVEQAEEVFAARCFKADELLGEPAACRWFLNWYDDVEDPKELFSEVAGILEGALLKKGSNDEPKQTEGLLGGLAG